MVLTIEVNKTVPRPWPLNGVRSEQMLAGSEVCPKSPWELAGSEVCPKAPWELRVSMHHSGGIWVGPGRRVFYKQGEREIMSQEAMSQED